MQISDEMLADAMRAFEPLSSVLRYREKDQGGWHASDKMAMRLALEVILPAVLAAERERCAGVADRAGEAARQNQTSHAVEKMIYETHATTADFIAAAIRALGDAGAMAEREPQASQQHDQ